MYLVRGKVNVQSDVRLELRFIHIWYLLAPCIAREVFVYRKHMAFLSPRDVQSQCRRVMTELWQN